MDKSTYLRNRLEHLKRLSSLVDDPAAHEGFKKIIQAYEGRLYECELERCLVEIAQATKSKNAYNDPAFWIDRLSKLEASRAQELEARR